MRRNISFIVSSGASLSPLSVSHSEGALRLGSLTSADGEGEVVGAVIVEFLVSLHLVAWWAVVLLHEGLLFLLVVLWLSRFPALAMRPALPVSLVGSSIAVVAFLELNPPMSAQPGEMWSVSCSGSGCAGRRYASLPV